MSGRVVRTSEEPGRPRAVELLRNRDFAAYWWGGMLSGPGTWLHNVTASVLMLELTGSPFMVGVVNFATFVPTLLFSLPAGSLGDRVSRRGIVVVASACAGLTAGVLAVLTARGGLGPWALVLFCFLLGTAAAVSKPALSAILPALVARKDVGAATALNVVQFQFGQIVGPGLASVILLVGTPATAFALNAVSFVGPIVSMALIRPRPAPATAMERTGPGAARRGSVREGMAYIISSPVMPAILLTVVLGNAAVEALRTLSPTIAQGLGAAEVAGVVVMGYSLGALLGLLGFGWIERVVPPTWILTVAFLLQALGLLAVAVAPTLAVTVVAAAPIGVGFSIVTPLLSAALQNLSPEGMRSRVMATFSMAHLGLRPLFALAAGALATLVGPDLTLVAFALLALGAVGYVRRRRVAWPETPPDVGRT